MNFQKPGRVLYGTKILLVSEEFVAHREINLPAENETKRKHQVGNVTGSLGRLHSGDNGDGEGRSEEEEHLHVEPHEEPSNVDSVGPFRVSVVANGIVPAQEEDGSDKNRPRDLDNDVGEDEDFPRVCLGRTFTRFVQGTLGDEVGHDLLHELREQEEHLSLDGASHVTFADSP
jgi:hypothetical protein